MYQMSEINLITENMLEEILKNIEQAKAIYLMPSFVMHSGVRLLSPYLKQALDKGVDVKLLTGDYLFVTQPEGLRELIKLDQRIEVRLWHSNGIAFHPKSYLFESSNGNGRLIVGSSNLSRSALTHGVEWNLSMEASAHPKTFDEALDQFMKYFYHKQTSPVNQETLVTYETDYIDYHQSNPNFVEHWTELEELAVMFEDEKEHLPTAILQRASTLKHGLITPRPAQIEALEELEKTLEENYDKAMIVMATGLGKTYLAGFFAKRFQKVLFIAHREEILYQAQKSFQQIMPDKISGIYNGKHKDLDCDYLFASIYTLSIRSHLEKFSSDEFDLIIVDEFHHAAANSYQRVLDYFNASFLLGITATPDRMDNKDVYAICDGNVAYQLHFLEAIQKGWLSPFHYHGIYDETDYSQIRWLGTRYDKEALLAAQLQERMTKNIFEAWNKYKQTRTIGFCSSISQANFLREYFVKNGIQAISLHSGSRDFSRSEVIRKLEEGDIDVVFTVDLFNEGVDIPAVDTLLFVRPTESLTVFTQQIGRGLRLAPGKDHCTIIDLIGNYRNADVKLSVLNTGLQSANPINKAFVLPNAPDLCEIHFDTRVVDLLKEFSNKRQPRKEKLREAYLELKQELGRRPSYLELHLTGGQLGKEYSQEFKSYFGFLNWAEDLSDREKQIYERYSNWLIEVEKTGMTKSYKMIVLLYMLNRGEEEWYQPVIPDEVAPFFHQYLMEKEFRKRIDFSDKHSKTLWKYDKDKVSNLILNMPMTKWSGSSKGLTSFVDGRFSIEVDIERNDMNTLFDWTYQICLYRLHSHFERKG